MNVVMLLRSDAQKERSVIQVASEIGERDRAEGDQKEIARLYAHDFRDAGFRIESRYHSAAG